MHMICLQVHVRFSGGDCLGSSGRNHLCQAWTAGQSIVSFARCKSIGLGPVTTRFLDSVIIVAKFISYTV